MKRSVVNNVKELREHELSPFPPTSPLLLLSSCNDDAQVPSGSLGVIRQRHQDRYLGKRPV